MTAVSSAYYRTRRALLTLMSSGDAQQGRQWQTNTIDRVTDDKVTLKTNYTGEGGSHHFKPVILDSTACIYEHEDLFPSYKTRGTVISVMRRHTLELASFQPQQQCWSLMTKPRNIFKNNTDSLCHRGLNQYLVRATHFILDPWDSAISILCPQHMEGTMIHWKKSSVFLFLLSL